MFEKIIEEIKKRDNFFILTHHNADVDAIASAFALKHALEILKKKVKIGIPESVSEAARRFLIGDVEINPRINDENIIVVDTSAPEQLEPIKVSEVFLVIDQAGSQVMLRDNL